MASRNQDDSLPDHPTGASCEGVALLSERIIIESRNRAVLRDTLALAFQDDPAMSWILPDPAERARRLPMMFDVVIPGDLKAGTAFASPGGEGATLWRAPGKADTGRLEMLRLIFPLIHTFGSALGRAIQIADAIDKCHPKTFDFWYLHYAGVRPEHQGKGWGGAAIRAGIARAKADGLPAWLETATLSNVGLYQSLGFKVVEEWDIPNGGPHFWAMLRPA
jgi:ribosomal protein S18 acetylase RimI-like enzyme